MPRHPKKGSLPVFTDSIGNAMNYALAFSGANYYSLDTTEPSAVKTGYVYDINDYAVGLNIRSVKKI